MTTTVLDPPTEGVPVSGPAQDDADTVLERLYDEHHVRLVRLAYLLLGDAGRAEDVVQDSFVALWPKLDGLRGADLPAYLRRTVVNRSRSALRHLVVVDKHARTQTEQHADAADAPALAAAVRREVVAALAALPRRQREVVVLRYYLDLSERETAQALGISQGAVKSHASRGTTALRARLADHRTPETR